MIKKFKPRNSLVLLRKVEKKEELVGKVIVSGPDGGLFAEFEIVEVGPGSTEMLTTGSKSETHDLKPGQRVWVGWKAKGQGGLNRMACQEIIVNGEILYLIEQMSITGVIAEPGETLSTSKTLAEPEKSAGPSLVIA